MPCVVADRLKSKAQVFGVGENYIESELKTSVLCSFFETYKLYTFFSDLRALVSFAPSCLPRILIMLMQNIADILKFRNKQLHTRAYLFLDIWELSYRPTLIVLQNRASRVLWNDFFKVNVHWWYFFFSPLRWCSTTSTQRSCTAT